MTLHDKKLQIVLVICATLLIAMWSIMAFNTARYNRSHPQKEQPMDAQERAELACINHGGVPIKTGSGNIMTHCEAVR